MLTHVAIYWSAYSLARVFPLRHHHLGQLLDVSLFPSGRANVGLDLTYIFAPSFYSFCSVAEKERGGEGFLDSCPTRVVHPEARAREVLEVWFHVFTVLVIEILYYAARSSLFTALYLCGFFLSVGTSSIVQCGPKFPLGLITFQHFLVSIQPASFTSGSSVLASWQTSFRSTWLSFCN